MPKRASIGFQGKMGFTPQLPLYPIPAVARVSPSSLPPSKPKPRSRVAGLPRPDSVYATYCSQCRRLGVKPVPMAQAKVLIRKWVDELARQQSPDAQNGAGSAIGTSARLQ